MDFNESTAKPITLNLAPHEYKAIEERSKKNRRTIEEEATIMLLMDLVADGQIHDSAARVGWVVTRLDE